MREEIVYNGHAYQRYPDSSRRSDRVYYKRTPAKGRPIFLHRQVWEDAHGAIPDGYEIHHIDGNPSNNALENLECVSHVEHMARHPWDSGRKKRNAVHLKRIGELAKAWHSSPEGLEEHRRIGALAYKNYVPTPKRCAHCGEEFLPRALGGRDLYCSNACKSAARRASGIDNVGRVCECCGKAFTVNKYSGRRFCCRSCARRRCRAAG